MSEVSDVIDNLTGELERFREMHAETLIEHAKERDRWAAQLSVARVLLTKLEAHIRDAREMFHVLRNDKGRDDQGLDMKHIDTWLRAVHKTLFRGEDGGMSTG
jgi:hypothetical protein